MSLLTSASVWSNDDNSNKKRTPSTRKTIKRTDSREEEMPNTIDDTNEKQEVRNDHVNMLLNKITSVNSDNAGNKLGDFNPIVNPSLNVPSFPRYDDIDENTIYGSDALGKASVGPSSGPDKNYSNYNRSYDTPPTYRHQVMGGGGTNDQFNNKLLDKINYMIHMLEEQHNEKTNNITEEFILYTFLGIFIIFIVDSFSRAGKYIR